MIITRTPFRVSFVGGGSDLRDFYRQHEGAVLSTSIKKYIYISSQNFFYKTGYRLKYSKTETTSSLEKIQHPIFREALRMFDLDGLELCSIADIPSGTGLGSSSTFTVGLIRNLSEISKLRMSEEEIAEMACKIEIDVLGNPIGKQDQYSAAFGGLNVIRFSENNVKVMPVKISSEVFTNLEKKLLMFYTGQSREASKILSEQKENMANQKKVTILRKMVKLVDVCKESLESGNLVAFGQMLHENWKLKKHLSSQISSSAIDDIYSRGLESGAIGGKLLGAGGSGFLLFFCPEEYHGSLKKSLSEFEEVPFKMDKGGTQLVFNDNQ